MPTTRGHMASCKGITLKPAPIGCLRVDSPVTLHRFVARTMLISDAMEEFDSITTVGGGKPRSVNAASTDLRAMTLGPGNIQDCLAKSENWTFAVKKIG